MAKKQRRFYGETVLFSTEDAEANEYNRQCEDNNKPQLGENT